MLNKFFSLLLIIVPILLSAQAPKKMPLDGQTFIAEIIKEGKGISFGSSAQPFAASFLQIPFRKGTCTL